MGKATGSRERAPDDRLRVPTIQTNNSDGWWARRKRAFSHPTAPSKPPRQRQPHRQRLRGMNVAVGDAADRLARQPRQIVIFDLVGSRVEEVEHVELHPQAVVEPVTRARIEDQG